MRIRLTARLSGQEDDARALRGMLESIATLTGLGEGESGLLVLAGHEALANIVRHGYGGDLSGQVVVRVRAMAGEIEVLLADRCSPIGAENLCPREWDDARPGGMGIRIMQKALDVVEHRPRPGRGNVIRMVRSHREASEEESAC